MVQLKSDEKPVVERQKDALNQLTNLFERYDRRLTSKPRDIAKCYVKDGLCIALKLRSRRNNKVFHVVVSAIDVRCKQECCLPVASSNQYSVADDCRGRNGIRGNQVAMSVRDKTGAALESKPYYLPTEQTECAHGEGGNGIDGDKPRCPMPAVTLEIMEGAKVNVPSRVRLCCPDQGGCSTGKQLFKFLNFGFVFLNICSEGKLNTCFNSPVHLRKSGNHIIQRLPQIRQNVTCPHLKDWRELLDQLEMPNFLCLIRIETGPTFIRIGSEKLAKYGVEVLDLGFGPFGLGESS